MIPAVLAAVLAAGSLVGTPATVHVTPNGHGGACSASRPCDLRTALRRGRSVVELGGGTYRVTAPLIVRDSGVTLRAAPGQRPVISGARRIAGFGLYDPAKNVYRAAVPAGLDARELFVDGVRAVRARSATNPPGFTASATGFTTTDPSYASWRNPDQVEVVRNNAWKQMRCPLSAITTTELVVQPACWANNHTAVPNLGFPFNGAGLPTLDGITWIENAYELLGTPGQFYLDGRGGYLYYVPRAGENLATADVELPVASELLDIAGTPGHLAPVNDDDPHASYAGQWQTQGARPYGDLDNDVHFTTANGDSVSYRFTGTGLQMLSETNDDAGTADVYVDGTKVSTIDAYGMPRLAQQPIVSITGLRKGDHTVRVVKTGGSYLVVDGFTVIPDDIAPARDITVRGITFEYSSWIEPNRTGYVDNQAGVLWNPVTHKPVRIPAAIQVHRGQRVTFDGVTVAHTGGSGIDLADQTRDSTVTNATISDTGGGGVAIGEVDDYYQTEPALMTSGNTVTRTEITHPGRQYADAVGIWTGITRGTTLSHNEVGYTPYSGMSIGWGWGWASDCTLQAKQGLPVPCRHGTTYNGDIHVLNNHVHSVMGALFDGGPIYTNGGSASASEFAGNVLSECIDGCNMIYHDEGSALWDTHDNLVRFGNGSLWTNLWTPSIHDDHIHDNFSDTAAFNNSGTNIDFEQATVVTGGRWPPAAQAIIAAAGTGRPPGTPADDDDLRIAYAGTWSSSGSRGLGDLDDGVHYTTTDGDSATFTFAGAAVSLLTETNADEGDIAITLDGTAVGTVSAYSATRAARQAVYSASGLGAGRHTLTVTKAGGTYLLVDGFGAG